ncbi:MAG: hypothetical protein JW781_09585 [Deltaproteobacteria bacterium]|nr:hypothetical protein [Candidatus Anaeroferrophillacea bacterium]
MNDGFATAPAAAPCRIPVNPMSLPAPPTSRRLAAAGRQRVRCRHRSAFSGDARGFARSGSPAALIPLLLLAALLWPAVLPPRPAAAADPLFSSSSGSPVAITSDTLEIDQKGGRAVFRGSVEAQQDSTRLTAGVLTVIFTTENNEVAEIIAEKEVTITLNGKLATCRKAHYFAADERIELTGDPAINEESNVIRGTKIVFYLREERSVIEGKKDSRVKTTIYPGSGGLFNAPADR